MIRKVLFWGGVAFTISFVAYRPAAARDVFASLGGGIVDVFRTLGDFFSTLVG